MGGLQRKRPGIFDLGERVKFWITAGCVASVVAALTSISTGGVVQASPSRAQAADPSTNPASGHPYRHGAVRLRGSSHAQGTHPAGAASTANEVVYRDGIDGVGVTTGPPQVYLIFWGSQWGTQTTDSLGYLAYSGDPESMAPDIEAFFAGLGSQGELWSGVVTQYCEGVAVGVTSCPGSATHVGYPKGTLGSLAGVWEDSSSVAPQQASAHQIGQEAAKAAGVFGNTTSASNRDAQYFIISPTGTNPDGFNTTSGQFCA